MSRSGAILVLLHRPDGIGCAQAQALQQQAARCAWNAEDRVRVTRCRAVYRPRRAAAHTRGRRVRLLCFPQVLEQPARERSLLYHRGGRDRVRLHVRRWACAGNASLSRWPDLTHACTAACPSPCATATATSVAPSLATRTSLYPCAAPHTSHVRLHLGPRRAAVAHCSPGLTRCCAGVVGVVACGPAFLRLTLENLCRGVGTVYCEAFGAAIGTAILPGTGTFVGQFVFSVVPMFF